MAAPDPGGWKGAMDREMECLKSHDVYELMPLEPGWVLNPQVQERCSQEEQGPIGARGNHQCPGVDYGGLFSPVLYLDSLRTLLALAAIRDLDIIHIDITSVYLHGTLKVGPNME